MFGHIIDAVMMCGIGSFFLLMRVGKIRAHKDPEEQAAWIKKYGELMVAAGVIILLGGIYHAIRAIL